MPRSSTPEAPPHLPLRLEATYIAKTLVFEGVLLVVAMCYKAIESEVEVFMTAFFEGILTDALDIIEATHKARIEMIQYQLRRAPRFAKEVEIADHVLPVLYRNVQLESMRLKISKTEEDMRGNLVGDGQEKEKPKNDIEVLGRDCDILEIDPRMAMENKVLFLRGQAGCGGTVLLRYCEKWWLDSGWINGTIYMSL
jgi:hypothetical protein